MAYQVIVTKRAEKDLQAIAQPFQKAIRDAIAELATTPRPNGVVKLAARKNEWRIRVGTYRVIYTIEDGQTLVVEVIRVGHRREIY